VAQNPSDVRTGLKRRVADRSDLRNLLQTLPGDYRPPYFDNLLPEGALLELVEREFGAGLSSV
jgi:hypothetical protein